MSFLKLIFAWNVDLMTAVPFIDSSIHNNSKAV